MTFLLQKFNAISRTRTEARARNGLRSSASGIAFTGRLAACLLLAGFLGVGSAMAQIPHVVRVGGGPLSVSVADANNGVHHFVIGDGEAMTPTDADGTFLVGGIALITYDNTTGSKMVTVNPIAAGKFKLAVAPTPADDLTTEAGSNNLGTAINFEVQSASAPMLTGAGAGEAYNAGTQAADAMEALELTPRDDASKEYKTVIPWFSDPNDVFLTYSASADPAKFCKPTGGGDTGNVRNACGATEDAVVATATVPTGSSTLTVALTDKAKADNDSSNVAIWVFAHDAAGEYARKQINLTVGSPTNPYITMDGAQPDVVLREDATENTTIDLATGFADPQLGEGSSRANPDATALTYSVSISDATAPKVGTENEFTWVTPAMTAEVTLTNVASGVGHSAASLEIRPRTAGAATFTVTATDRGLQCREDFTLRAASTTETDHAELKIDKCIGDTNTDVAGDSTLAFPDAQSVKDVFTVTVVTKTTPMADMAIPAQTVIGDSTAIMFDLEDLNGDKDGTPKAFADPTEGGLTYMVVAEKVKDKDIAMISVDGSMVTIAPIWRAGTANTTVTVTATNNLDEANTTPPAVTFNLTVETATKPVVNLLLQPLLGALPPFNIPVGMSMTFDLQDVTKNLEGVPEMFKGQPLFIDPNAAPEDALPGGLLYKVRPEDVETQHRYDNLSRENHVVTSAGTVSLDPQAAMLTITGTAPNDIAVTVWAIDRERMMTSATMMFMVTSATSAEDAELPTEVELSQNYPNPFNPQTTIDYALPQAGDVSLVVYDMLGREVDVLLDGPQAAGRHTVRFGANHLPNGAYVYRLVAGDKTITRTMVLVK